MIIDMKFSVGDTVIRSVNGREYTVTQIVIDRNGLMYRCWNADWSNSGRTLFCEDELAAKRDEK